MELDTIDNHSSIPDLESSGRAYKLYGFMLPLNLVFKNPLFLKKHSILTPQVRTRLRV